MKLAGWIMAALGIAFAFAAFGTEPLPPWWAFAGAAALFVVGVTFALGSKLVLWARRVAYVIRDLRSAAKGLPGPPPPAPDLMATMAKPMKAVPRPPHPSEDP